MVGLADVAKSKCSFYLLALSFELGTKSSFFSLDRISRVGFSRWRRNYSGAFFVVLVGCGGERNGILNN